MLNISKHRVNDQLSSRNLETLIKVEKRKSNKVLPRLIGGTFIILGFVIQELPSKYQMTMFTKSVLNMQSNNGRIFEYGKII